MLASTTEAQSFREVPPTSSDVPNRLGTILEESNVLQHHNEDHSREFKYHKHCLRAINNLSGIPPITDSPSNPFSSIENTNTAQPMVPRHDHSRPPSTSSNGEDIPADNSTSISSSDSIYGSRGGAHVGQHRTPRHQARRPVTTANARAAVPPKKKAARDVWTFFKKEDKGRACVFCEYVVLLSVLIHLLTINHFLELDTSIP